MRDRLASFDSCLRIPDWPHRLGSNFARIIAGLGVPRMQLAHLIGSHQWENCTGFSVSVWGLITSQLRSAILIALPCPALQSPDLRLQLSSAFCSHVTALMRRPLRPRTIMRSVDTSWLGLTGCHRTVLPHPDAIPSDH